MNAENIGRSRVDDEDNNKSTAREPEEF